MKAEPVKSKTQNTQTEIRIKARKPAKVRTALKAWAKSAEQFDTDLLNLEGAPPWVEKALLEVVKVTLPGRRLPTSGEWDLELIGELLGRLQAFTQVFAGEIPIGPAVQAECEQLGKFVDSQPKPDHWDAKIQAHTLDFQTRMEATSAAIPATMAAALASSHEDSLKFQTGLIRGLNLSPDDLVTGNVFQRHTKIFWVLAGMWRTWVKCRSVAEVHRILCRALGEMTVGSLKHFEARVVKKIGMKLGPAGRPSKGKKSPQH